MTEPTRRVHVNRGKDGCSWEDWPESSVRALIDGANAARAKRAEDMPDDSAALGAMFQAHQRLKEMGWRDAIYAPKDGSPLELVEPGSTGIHAGYRDAEGRFWIVDDDVWPSRPTLFRQPGATP